MRSDEWKTYRTRFLVKAKQLSSTLSFTDHLGRQHYGRKGDYLVESCDGVVTIAPRRIFEDVYVPMSLLDMSNSLALSNDSDCVAHNDSNLRDIAGEILDLQTIETQKLRTPNTAPSRVGPYDRARRKSPQPVRSGRAPAQLGLM